VSSSSRTAAVAVLVSASSLIGCLGPTTSVIATGGARPPRAGDCDVRVVASTPNGYEEIGVIATNAVTYRLDVYKRVVTPAVCGAGGEVVVAQINGAGTIVRGVVMAKAREHAE
jgi:hypothetical protein